MEYREVKTIIYDENGYKETITEMVPIMEVPIEEIINQKEQQLLQMYNELQALKDKQ